MIAATTRTQIESPPSELATRVSAPAPSPAATLGPSLTSCDQFVQVGNEVGLGLAEVFDVRLAGGSIIVQLALFALCGNVIGGRMVLADVRGHGLEGVGAVAAGRGAGYAEGRGPWPRPCRWPPGARSGTRACNRTAADGGALRRFRLGAPDPGTSSTSFQSRITAPAAGAPSRLQCEQDSLKAQPVCGETGEALMHEQVADPADPKRLNW